MQERGNLQVAFKQSWFATAALLWLFFTASFSNKAFLSAHLNYLPISGQVDRASATETVHSGSIIGRVELKTIKIGILSFQKGSVRPPPCVVDRRTGGSLTRRPQGLFSVFQPKQLGE